ncbi:sulfurtransferase [Mariluticola halotolerans]|uniref:sulfurtransferase n=1 Tax=Mariluticola halotolerans TaxID=2909283 RepID=UPI0026E45D7C|nr:sulfurtransferase [Mariluticola halotolerans]UJQ94078.1 sulfurtransferase [Mariluticola halotolerans]
MRNAIFAFALAAGLTGAATAQATEVTPLVDAQWVIEHGADDNVVLIDIRGDIENTDLGDAPYIAHAVVAPYSTAGWRTEIQGVPGMLPEIDDVVELISSLGVDDSSHVVIVPWGTDSSDFGGATRVYWTFKYLGHDAVSILDGGWRQYDAAGGERVAAPVEPVKATFTADVQPQLLATTEQVEAARARGVKLIDGRPAAQYRGEAKSPVARVAGTIPGALNIQNGDLYSADYASFADPEVVASLAEGVGLGADEENIAFCNTGHWASVVWFGLSEIQGNKNTSMYDGSMAEWTADESRPVE